MRQKNSNSKKQAQVIRSPESLNSLSGMSVFLAGTIDDGRSINWQDQFVKQLEVFDVTILNPRRAEWDASWEQTIENQQFKEQVEWELEALAAASYIFIYFAPGSYSPISLLELGLYANSQKVVIVCPDGFWKKGNVEIVAEKFSIPLCSNMEDGLALLTSKILPS